MVSAGDHERLPEKEDSSQSYDGSRDGEYVVDKKDLKKLRKGLNLAHTSKVVDDLVGKTLDEYKEELELRAKGVNIGGNKPERLNASPSHPRSPVKSRRLGNKTLPGNKPDVAAVRKPANILKNSPINVTGNNDMAKVWKLAMDGKSGFKMSNRLKKRLAKKGK